MSSTRELIIVGEADPIRVSAGFADINTGFVDINNHICILGQPETLRRLATALHEAAELAEASGDEQ